MVVATICNHKGGTGKTTSALGLAAALGLGGKRVLLVDLDPQAFLSHALGAKDPPVEQSSLALFEEEARLDQLAPQAMNGFDLLPAHGRLTRRMRRLHQPTDVLWVKETLERSFPGEGDANDERGYDLVLFDTAAAVTVYSINALVASRHALIPVTPEYQPVVGGKQTYQTARMVQGRLNPSLEDPRFLLTQVDGRKKEHTRYQEHMRERYGQRVMRRVIRTSSALARTPRDGSTVFDYAPNARGARDYANAADEWLAYISATPGAEENQASSNTAPDRKGGAPASAAASDAGAAMAGSVD